MGTLPQLRQGIRLCICMQHWCNIWPFFGGDFVNNKQDYWKANVRLLGLLLSIYSSCRSVLAFC